MVGYIKWTEVVVTCFRANYLSIYMVKLIISMKKILVKMSGLWVDTNPNVRKRADYNDDEDDNSKLWTRQQIRWMA